MADKFLISAVTNREAANIAKAARIPLGSWEYVPHLPSARRQALEGRTVSSERYLVGHFSKDERRQLIQEVIP